MKYFTGNYLTRAAAILFLAAALAIPTRPVLGQEEVEEEDKVEIGPRIGLDIDNEQFLLGVQAEFDDVFGPLALAPSFDYGTGNDLTTYALNGDLRLDLIAPPGAITGIYIGAGPSLVVWKPSGLDDDTEIGFTVSTGMTLRLGRASDYNLEARVGFGDVPDIRILLGILF